MKLVSVVSARPNFVKLSGFYHAYTQYAPKGWEHVLVHTGQHYDPLFSEIFFEQLKLPQPDHALGIDPANREEFVEAVSTGLTPLLKEIQPDLVLLYGDVNGTLGAARAAQNAEVQMAHVEAGLRSFDRTMPEELNRLEIDQTAQLLLCSERSGVENLAKEHLTEGVHLVGNTMIDTLRRMMPLIKQEPLPDKTPESFSIVTLHRPSNVDSSESLRKNLEFLGSVSSRCPLVLPMHHRTKAAIERFGLQDLLPKHLQAIPPLGYIPFLALMRKAKFLLTDSGGIQEEATFLKKRCFTLRKNTERPSTIESGSNFLIDIAGAEDREQVLSYAEDPTPPEVAIPEIWDGMAGKRIVELLQKVYT